MFSLILFKCDQKNHLAGQGDNDLIIVQIDLDLLLLHWLISLSLGVFSDSFFDFIYCSFTVED